MIREGDRVVAFAPSKAGIMERALLLALVEFAPNIEPSVPKLAVMLGTNDRQVRRLIQRCESLGLLHVVHRVGQRSRYELTLPDPGLSVTPDGASPLTERPGTPDTQSGEPLTERPPKQTTKRATADNTLHVATGDAPETPGSSSKKPKGKVSSNGKNRGRPKKVDPPDPRVRVFWDHWHAEFRRIKGEDPTLTPRQHGRAGRAFKEMAVALDANTSITDSEATGKVVITRAIEAGYHVQPWAIAEKFNNYTGRKAPQRGTNGTPIQPNHGNFDVSEYTEAAQ